MNRTDLEADGEDVLGMWEAAAKVGARDGSLGFVTVDGVGVVKPRNCVDSVECWVRSCVSWSFRGDSVLLVERILAGRCLE